jgi:hypothetical protein
MLRLSRIFRPGILLALLVIPSMSANAQFDKIKKKVSGLGSSSEVDTIIRDIDATRAKSAYARVSLSLADDIIRRQALRNTTKKSAEGQIEKDKQELAALDQSIAAKKKLLAEVGKESNSGKYDEKTAAEVDRQATADEEQREQRRAQVDAEIADQEKREKDMSDKDRENYGKLARLLFGAAKEERESVESAQGLKPRAETAATNTKNSPLSLASTQPKKLNDGIEGLGKILSEGPQHAATLAAVANHLAKIGGVDLSDPKFQPKVVTDEDEVPEWK